MAKRILIKSTEHHERLNKKYKGIHKSHLMTTYKDLVPVEMEGKMSAEIQTLMPFSKYDFRIYSENKIGVSGPSSPNIRIQTKEEAPEGPPTSIIAVANSSQSLVVTWKVRNKLEYRNFLSKTRKLTQSSCFN